MALCDPCYGLFRILEQESVRDPLGDEDQDNDEQGAKPTAFRNWISARDNKGAIPKTFPQLPGLIHSTWESFCKSLDCFCPICWIVWRHIRDSPMASYRDKAQVHQKFYLWLSGRYNMMDVSGTLSLQCSHDMKARNAIPLRFKRTTKQRFEGNHLQTLLDGD